MISQPSTDFREEIMTVGEGKTTAGEIIEDTIYQQDRSV